MSVRLYKCKNCDSPLPPEISKKLEFNFCPTCGNLYPQTVLYIDNYFRIIQLSKELENIKKLLLKSEMNAAVREAIIKFETVVRNKSGLIDNMGSGLMADAFSFKADQKTKEIFEQPKIKLNDLSNISKRNEQEGFKLMTMGFMQGIRNIYMHTEGADRLYYALQIITLIDLFLKQIKGGSIASCGDGIANLAK